MGFQVVKAALYGTGTPAPVPSREGRVMGRAVEQELRGRSFFSRACERAPGNSLGAPEGAGYLSHLGDVLGSEPHMNQKLLGCL